MPVLDRLTALQRHCLMALEVDCFHWHETPSTAAILPAASNASAEPSGQADPSRPMPSVPEVRVCLIAEAAECSAPLVRALARALGAQVLIASAARPVGAVLVSIAQAAPEAALILPSLDRLRTEPRLKQHSWPRIRSFLRSLRKSREP